MAPVEGLEVEVPAGCELDDLLNVFECLPMSPTDSQQERVQHLTPEGARKGATDAPVDFHAEAIKMMPYAEPGMLMRAAKYIARQVGAVQCMVLWIFVWYTECWTGRGQPNCPMVVNCITVLRHALLLWY